VAVVSVLGDKDARAMVRTLAGACRSVVATRSSHPRAASPERLAALAEEEGVPAIAVGDPRRAVALAREAAGRRGAVLVCGSLYLLADVRSGLMRAGRRSAPARLARG
jgi:dihydrofolate synthase/folylpolyglutamate synthase